MAEREPLSTGRAPSRGDFRRRRVVALLGLVGAVVLIVVAVSAALPHVHRRHAAPPPPPPPPKPFRVVFPEGFTRSQMAERVGAVAAIARRKRRGSVRLAAPAYLNATKRLSVPCFSPRLRDKVEGFLFPATYDFLAKTTSRQLVRDQAQAFCRNWRKLDLAYARSKNLTPYDVLTIASMVEKEAQAPEERQLISAVIYNRLGLPPTPIANPGLASLRAAAHPAKVDYLYFVRKPDKVHHFFTASGAAFQQYECAHGYGC